jgi:hypothetical protein
MRGNLADLVALKIASEPVLRKWIDGLSDDEPWIIKRGSGKGDAYVLDLDGAVASWRGQEDAKTQAARDKAEMLKQFGLDLGLSESAESDIGISIGERKMLLEEEYAAIKLGEKRGDLIRKSDVEAAVADALSTNRSNWEGFSADLAMKLDLDRAQIVIVEAMVATRLHGFADKLEHLGQADGNDGTSTSTALEDTRIYERA